MNIKFLKFIVIFMGVLIVLGITILGVSFYVKFQNLSSKKITNNLIINTPEKMNFIDYKIIENKIYISYENLEKVLIDIYSLKNHKNLKKIEILK